MLDIPKRLKKSYCEISPKKTQALVGLPHSCLTYWDGDASTYRHGFRKGLHTTFCVRPENGSAETTPGRCPWYRLRYSLRSVPSQNRLW